VFQRAATPSTARAAGQNRREPGERRQGERQRRQTSASPRRAHDE
jgi:hypothetical protein